MLELMRSTIADRAHAIGVRANTQGEALAFDLACKHSAEFMLVGAQMRSDKERKNAWKARRDAAKDELRMSLGISWFVWVFASAALRKIIEAIFDYVWDSSRAISVEYETKVRDARA